MIFNMNQKHEILTSSTKRVPRKSIITYVIEYPQRIVSERKLILKNHASKLFYCSQFILKTSRLLITNLLISHNSAKYYLYSRDILLTSHYDILDLLFRVMI